MTLDEQKRAIELLTGAAHQFRYYEQNHRSKAESLSKLVAGEKLMAEAITKAEVNAARAADIEMFLGRMARRGEA